MPERDGYIAGVPCWVDTSQPDPEAATAFYSGVFGWELEDVMPPDSPGKYFMARIRGLDVAADRPAGHVQAAGQLVAGPVAASLEHRQQLQQAARRGLAHNSLMICSIEDRS